MATAVRDAVSSVSSEHICMFMSVVGTLHTKLPNYFQADWSKHAYLLRRIPTLKDFDVWIDTIMGAEELRGAKISTAGGSSGSNKPPSNLTNANRQTSGSSNYGVRGGPTILNNYAESLLRQTAVECPACNDKSAHRLEECNTFARMTVNARAVLCAQNNRCFKCLIKGHYASKCRRQNASCTDCGAAHHKLLHGAERQFPVSSGPKILMVKSPLNSIKPVLLAIVPVVIEVKGAVKSTFAVLDPGSEATLITRPLASFLDLKGSPAVIRFGSFSSSVEILTDVVSFSLHSLDKACSFELEDAFVVPKINLSHRKINWPAIKHRWSHLAQLDLPALDSSSVEILLGMDVAAAHQTLQMLEPLAGEDGPTVYRTRFGLAVVGRIPKSLVTGPTTRRTVNLQSIPPLLPCMMDRTHSFQQPTARISAARSLQQQEDNQMLDIMKRSIIFTMCGYQIDLPLRTDHPEIPNNRNHAISRFHGLERRLTEPSMRELASRYEQIVEKLISSGTVVPVARSAIDEPKGLVWYLPHFFVTNPNKPGKTRVVFDAAARFRSISYNDLFLRGPPSIPSLVGVLLRSRQFRVALFADITAFYHRVGVAKHHQSLQRFVYRKFGSDAQINTYQFTTLIFGAICSSSAAVFVLQHAANKCFEFPIVAEKMKDNFYSDNMIDSFETEEEAMDFARQVTKSLEAGGFTLTAFASSSAKVLKSIPMQHRSHQIIDLNLDGLQIEYLLGLEWDIATDTFCIRTRQLPSVATKRQLSSAISLVFDPFGLCLPVITGAKQIFQKTHKDSLDDSSRRGWDSPLPEETLVKWNDWTTHFHKLSFPRIPRCFRDHSFPLHGTSLRLVVYADASSVAYASVAYLRCQFEQKVAVNFVMAKGRLAPLKPTTVPRLELRAAVLAVELSLIIKKELRLPIADVEYHSDSQIVLHQLHSSGTKQPTFVNKRREYILQHSKVDSWHFVPSADNPADDSTRNTVPKDFGISCR
ncbi:uncharacterized protein LOC116936346 [Daphnia magna]|uniref:uncharacterized protein LOC116936346 n=1 Tax=Daphnia magna TaxID=35525 RepID=UPI001E1BA703|nr:uncharacterized protein LOC116936346 [Daphnia magna]